MSECESASSPSQYLDLVPIFFSYYMILRVFSKKRKEEKRAFNKMKNRKTKRQLKFLNKKDWRKKGEDL